MMRYGYLENCVNGYCGYGMNYFGRSPFMMILAGVIIVAIVIVVIALFSKKAKEPGTKDVEEALKLRYVKGEITEDEYQRMKKVVR